MHRHPRHPGPPPAQLGRRRPTDTHNLACVCGAHHRAIHRGHITISGNADTPSGLTITNRWNKPIAPQPPKPPPTPPPTGTWRHPTGEHLHHHDIYINPDPPPPHGDRDQRDDHGDEPA